MKLGAEMTTESSPVKPDFIVQPGPQLRDEKKQLKKKKYLYGAVAAAVIVLAVAGAVVAVTHFTTKANVEIIKAHMKINGEDHEEEVQIDKDNQLVKVVGKDEKVIIDYNRGLVTLISSEGCGVTPATRNNSFSMKEASDMKNAGEAETPVNAYLNAYYKGESIQDRTVVSTLAQKECKNKPMHWLIPSQGRTEYTTNSTGKARERRYYGNHGGCVWYNGPNANLCLSSSFRNRYRNVGYTGFKIPSYRMCAYPSNTLMRGQIFYSSRTAGHVMYTVYIPYSHVSSYHLRLNRVSDRACRQVSWSMKLRAYRT